MLSGRGLWCLWSSKSSSPSPLVGALRYSTYPKQPPLPRAPSDPSPAGGTRTGPSPPKAPPHAPPSSPPSLFALTKQLQSHAKRLDRPNTEKTWQQILQCGHPPDSFAYTALLSLYTKQGDITKSEQVYHQMLQSHLRPTLYAYTSLLSLYAKTTQLDKAERLWQDLRHSGLKPDIYLFTSLLSLYTKVGDVLRAEGLWAEMVQAGYKPTPFTYTTLLSLYARNGDVRRVEGLVKEMEEAGLELNVFSYTSLVVLYSRVKDREKAGEVWRKMVGSGYSPDLKSYNALLSLYCGLGDTRDAEKVVDEMRKVGFELDRVSYISLLGLCVKNGNLQEGVRLHNEIVSKKLWPCPQNPKEFTYVTTSLLSMYGSCGGLEDAERVFNECLKLQVPVDISVYSTMIHAYAQFGCGMEALKLFGNLCSKGLTPDKVTFTSLLTAFSTSLLPDKALEFVRVMKEKYGLIPDVIHHSCVVDALAYAGRLEQAEVYIKTTKSIQADVITLVSLLAACRLYGDVETAKRILNTAHKSIDVEEVKNYLQQNEQKKVASWIWVNNEVHRFVADKNHPEQDTVNRKVVELYDKISAAGFTPYSTPKSSKEEMLEKELCGHYDMLALAFGLLKMEEKKDQVVLFKNMCVCVECHEASKWVSKVFGFTIKLRESRRWHVFKAGTCSCKDCW